MVIEGFDTPHLGKFEVFQRLYDPRRTQESIGRLITRVCEKRQTPTNIATVRGLAGAALNYRPNPIELAGTPLVWAEATHALARDEDFRYFFSDSTQIPLEELLAIEAMVDNDVDEAAKRTASFIESVTQNEQLLDDFSQITGTKVDNQTDKLVLLGLLLSFTSHRGQQRQNVGEDNRPRPYFSHPLATALLYQKAWDETTEESTSPDEEWLHRQLFVNLMHDGFEDMIHKDPRVSFLNGKTIRSTPLFLKKVLLELGEDDEQVSRIIQDIMLVTKTRGLEGESQEADRYVQLCTSSIRAMVAKFCDTVHNKIIDTKQNKDGRQKTEAEYNHMLESIRTKIDRTMRDDFGHQLITSLLQIALRFERNHDGFMKEASIIQLGRKAASN